MIIGLIGSFLFIIIQMILIIDFAHAWNTMWLEGYESNNNKCYLAGKLRFKWLLLVQQIEVRYFWSCQFSGNLAA